MAEKEKENDKETQIPDNIPILPVRDIVVFPYMIIPLFVGREISIKAIEKALAESRMILLLTQRDLSIESPSSGDLYETGTVGMIMRMLKLPDGRVKILVQGLSKARVKGFSQTEPFMAADIEKIEEAKPASLTIEEEAQIRTVKEQLDKAVSHGKTILPDIMVVIENLDDPGRLADLVASNLGLKTEQAQEILEITDPVRKLKRVSDILGREIELLIVQQKIQSEARGEIDKTQREYFLREQLKAIQKELGDIDERAEEIKEFKNKIEEAKMPEKVMKEAEKQMKRLEKMHPDSAEAATIRTYLDWLVELPWSRSTKDNLDIKAAQKVLDEDHYDLEKVKERILEYLSVRKIKEKMKGPILCFIGPPGVGKTSLGRSIARSLGREFVRMSLGGVRDEAEIRGHRRTYVGALPGRIIQGIKTAGTNNPGFMLDEVDKIGMDFRGDPSSALLEVLDPEQNFAFADHYLAVPFDLTNVMFITTGNLADTIPSPLRDRMEIIYLSGYTTEEKLGIAKKYLLPKQLEEHGITPKILTIADNALNLLISQYTREAGVRNLEREIANLCRKVAKRIAEGKEKNFMITVKNLQSFLGVPKYLPEEEMEHDEVGVSTGLAWTEAGGDIIYIEATTMKGRGSLTLTGQLGDVMKESAQAALSYVRSTAKTLGIKDEIFAKTDIHIHVPAGAIPKDGPSAGITIATAVASVFTGRPVNKNIAMTGEVTLRGRVLPIGGLKEKTLAAKRMGIRKVILPKRNKKDLEDIAPYIKKDMEFIFADTMDQVLKVALKGKKRSPDRPSLMKLSQVGELPLLEMLRKRFSRKAGGVVLGIGDDAAVIRTDKNMLLTTDMMVEGVHFDLSWMTPFQLGFKLVSVNVSDIYAMGGKPHCVLLDFAAHKNCTTVFFERFFDGVEEALKTYGISLVGGDISAADRIMLSITAVGSAKKAVKRSGARIGDRIYVTGTLGDAACGLELLKKIHRPIDFGKSGNKGLPLPWDTVAPPVRRHLMPVARDPKRFASKATAMIDISDGLLIDLSRLCSESGVGAQIPASDIPVSDAMKKIASYLGLSPLDLALGGGEDYELLFTARPKERVDAFCIGEVIGSGLAVLDDRGRRMNVSHRGYQHFLLQG